MKLDTYFNKIKQIKDKALNMPLQNKIDRDTANFKVLKAANSIPKNAPDYNPDGSVTDYFKTRSVAEGVKQKMMKKK